MKRNSAVRRFLRDIKGETILEFAIVASVFFTMMLAVIEYGLIMMTKIAIESATEQVSRESGINASYPGCSTRSCVLISLIHDKTLGLINPNNINISSAVISSPTDAEPPEPDVCLLDPNDPYPATCSGAYSNNNGLPGYQQAGAPTDPAVGATGQLVEIRVSYTWQVMFPLLRPLLSSKDEDGTVHNGVVKMSSATVFKDEPF